MSQAKVDARKEYKKNRKTILAKEKRNQMITKWIAYLVILVILVGVGYSFYSKMNPKPQATAESFYGLTATDNYGILQPSLPDGQ